MLLASGEQVSIALLSMALQDLGVAAVSMTGQQVGIVTEAAHGRARILNIHTERVRACLAEGAVVVVAGFQGTATSANGNLEITTLGRGGSDTSAVALAAALEAERCEIYTDVEGVLTTDPRIVPSAQLLENISCDEMLELASLGAAVLHPRAVEIARNYGLPLVVRSSWSDHPGTCLTSNRRQRVAGAALELGKPVDALELVRHQGLIALSHVPDRPGVAAQLCEALSEAGINIDLVVQSLHEGASNDMAFTLEREELERGLYSCQQPEGPSGRSPTLRCGRLSRTGQAEPGGGWHHRPSQCGRQHVCHLGAGRYQPADDRHQRGEGELCD